MRFDVQFTDRVGIAHEILAVLAERQLNVVAVEVDPPHVYIDAPELTAVTLAELRPFLLEVPGVQDARAVDMLPGARRGLHLAALLAAMTDPVLAVDGQGTVVVANAAARAVAAIADPARTPIGLDTLFADPSLAAEVIASGFQMPAREVMLRGEPFLLEVQPITEASGSTSAGGVVLLQAPSRMGERIHALQHFAEGGFEKILGTSAPMRELRARAVRVAAVDAPLLILGDTGTGKELVAHACHRASRRADKPFFALNCAALPESLAESELFGYAPGAFTGAQRGGKPGLLELANSGTVFLDEIGEMSLYLQAKLLRFLSDGSFRRVGGEREVRVDVRVLSATHRNLDAMVASGQFREDLYYRLNVLNLRLPPLRERSEDILLLARHFIDRACAQSGRPQNEQTQSRLTAAASAALVANPWPGNVRQLENVIFRAVTMTDKTTLDLADLELATSGMSTATPAAEPESWTAAIAEFEESLLRRLYPRYPSSRKLSARLKTSHTMIANRLRAFGIGR